MNAVAMHSIPRETGIGRALAFALVVHAALLAFLWIGVRWQNETAVAEAEVWDIQTREAAPKPVPQPEPVAPPKAVKAPEAPGPKPVQREMIAKPDIALEREKKQKRREEEQRAQAEQARAEQAKREKLAKEAEEKRKLAEKKKRAQAEEKALASARAEEMRRITANTGPGGTGSAAKSTGSSTDASYAQKVSARIKANTAFSVPPGLNGNPAVEYSVELLPDGSLRSSPRKLKSSGVPGFDEAVLRAVEKSEPYPADRSGKVPPNFIISHKPKG